MLGRVKRLVVFYKFCIDNENQFHDLISTRGATFKILWVLFFLFSFSSFIHGWDDQIVFLNSWDAAR